MFTGKKRTRETDPPLKDEDEKHNNPKMGSDDKKNNPKMGNDETNDKTTTERPLPEGLHLECSRNWTHRLVTQFDCFYVNLNGLREKFDYFTAIDEKEEIILFPPETFEMWNSVHPMDLARLFCVDPDLRKHMNPYDLYGPPVSSWLVGGKKSLYHPGNGDWPRVTTGFGTKEWFSVTMVQIGWIYLCGNEGFQLEMIRLQIQEVEHCINQFTHWPEIAWNSLEKTWMFIKQKMNQEQLIPNIESPLHLWFVSLLTPLAWPCWKSVSEEMCTPKRENSPSIRIRWKIQDQHLPRWAARWNLWMTSSIIGQSRLTIPIYFMKECGLVLLRLGLIHAMTHPDWEPDWFQPFQTKMKSIVNPYNQAREFFLDIHKLEYQHLPETLKTWIQNQIPRHPDSLSENLERDFGMKLTKGLLENSSGQPAFL